MISNDGFRLNPVVSAWVGQTSVHLPQRIHSALLGTVRTGMLSGHAFSHFPQCMHFVGSNVMRYNEIRLKTPYRAPSGQT